MLLTAFIFSTTSFSVFADEPAYNDKQRFADEVLSLCEVNNNINIVDSNTVNTVQLKYAANDMEGALAWKMGQSRFGHLYFTRGD